ncbi:MAG TPA: hypothetical protein PK033_00930 [Acetivibrio sp.]|jgi:hypothetical protein|nr:hypothetical protein [Clostridium sp.]HOQ36383.1 hypothetical protein [Acetivibrio sp.]HPT91093.1 hypothetical protein [Acetivibrio sp.]HQA56430.1 hypothetical protein [Acetivibrio sp.]
MGDMILYLIVGTAAAVVLVLSVVLLVLKKKKKKEKASAPGIEYGSVSVFFDEENNVTVIPFAKDKHGKGRAVGKPTFLKAPYQPLALGQTVRSSMSLCKKRKIYPDDKLMNTLKCKDWSEFSYKKRNISIYYKDKLGLVLNTTKRTSDGSYSLNFRGYEKVLSKEAGDIELGLVIMNLLERCKC